MFYGSVSEWEGISKKTYSLCPSCILQKEQSPFRFKLEVTQDDIYRNERNYCHYENKQIAEKILVEPGMLYGILLCLSIFICPCVNLLYIFLY